MNETTAPPFTDAQLAALRELIADAVHEAVAPVAKQQTIWITQERKRLADPRRSATGKAI